MCAPVYLQFNTSLSGRTNLCIKLYPWWVKDAADMFPDFLPFPPDPSVVKDEQTQIIFAALFAVKSLYQVCDNFGDLRTQTWISGQKQTSMIRLHLRNLFSYAHFHDFCTNK